MLRRCIIKAMHRTIFNVTIIRHDTRDMIGSVTRFVVPCNIALITQRDIWHQGPGSDICTWRHEAIDRIPTGGIVGRSYRCILGCHFGIMQWIWRGVNLKCIDAYAVLEWENDTKLNSMYLPPNTRLIHKTKNRLTPPVTSVTLYETQ
jgi:hypothetical protein